MPSGKFYLYQRSNGYWYIGDIVDGRRVWKSSGTKTKGDALKVLRENKLRPTSKVVVPLLSQFASQFLSLQTTNLRESTLTRVYSPAFKSFLGICGDKPLSRYTPRDVEFFKKSRLEQLSVRSARKSRCSPTTINIEFRTLRSAFNTAIRWRYINDNPFCQSSQLKLPERNPVHITKSELARLLAAIRKPVLRDIVVFAVLTGLRLSELINLQWIDIDLEHKLITVRSKSDFSTKTGKNRVVPLNKFLAVALRGRRGTLDGDSYVFMNCGRRLQANYVSHSFKKYVRSIGLSDTIHFHSLRHTFATWLVQQGVSIYEIQKFLGHSNIEVTQVYSHLQGDKLHDSIDRISIASVNESHIE